MEKGLVSLLHADSIDPSRHVVCTMRGPGLLADALPEATPCVPLHAESKDRFAALRLARLIRAVRPDIIHARNFNTWADTRIAAKLARFATRNVAFGFHGLESDRGFLGTQRIRARRLRFHRIRFTSVSYAGRAQLMEQLSVPYDNITVLRNGIDTGAFSPTTQRMSVDARQRVGIDPRAFVVVTVASLVPVKEHVAMLRAIAAAQPKPERWTWLVVGEGPMSDKVKDVLRNIENPPQVIFAGRQADVRPHLHAADAFLLASQYEQLSIALLEAMAAGLPAIVTDVGDHADIVRHGVDGFVVRPGDGPSLSASLQRIAADKDCRKNMGIAARQHILDAHSLETTSRQYVRYYQSFTQSSAEQDQPCAASPASSQITV